MSHEIVAMRKQKDVHVEDHCMIDMLACNDEISYANEALYDEDYLY